MKTFFRCEYCDYTSSGGTIGDYMDIEEHEASCKMKVPQNNYNNYFEKEIDNEYEAENRNNEYNGVARKDFEREIYKQCDIEDRNK